MKVAASENYKTSDQRTVTKLLLKSTLKQLPHARRKLLLQNEYKK